MPIEYDLTLGYNIDSQGERETHSPDGGSLKELTPLSHNNKNDKENKTMSKTELISKIEALNEWDFTGGAFAYYNPQMIGYNAWYESLQFTYQNQYARFFTF